MRWNAAEFGLGSQIAVALADYPAQRTTQQEKQKLRLSRKDADDLLEGIALKPVGQPPLGIVPVRHLFRLLNFSETHPFQWRLEHKLVQSLVLRQFCPEYVPVTCGLIRYIAEH